MVKDIRAAEKALGHVNYSLTEKEKESVVFRRSLFVVKDVRIGEPFTPENVRCIRPGYGLPPRYYDEILNKKSTHNIIAGTPLTWEHLFQTNE